MYCHHHRPLPFPIRFNFDNLQRRSQLEILQTRILMWFGCGEERVWKYCPQTETSICKCKQLAASALCAICKKLSKQKRKRLCWEIHFSLEQVWENIQAHFVPGRYTLYRHQQFLWNLIALIRIKWTRSSWFTQLLFHF